MEPLGEHPVTWRVRLVILATSIALTSVLAEGMIRIADGNALPFLALFRTTPNGHIALSPQTAMQVRHATGRTYSIAIDTRGLRAEAADAPVSSGGWLAVGDSQVLGMGVSYSETFAGRSGPVSIQNGGVPGFGVEDALGHAERLVTEVDPDGILVFVNQANDWEEVGLPVESRYRVRGGFLVTTAEATTAKGTFLATPFARMHLLFFAVHSVLADPSKLAPDAPLPSWLGQPDDMIDQSARIASSISAFASEHPDVAVAAAFLPVDFATSSARAELSPFAEMARRAPRPPWQDTALRDQIAEALGPVPLIDLSSTLRNTTDAFLERDYHLAPAGHAAIADVLASELSGYERRDD